MKRYLLFISLLLITSCTQTITTPTPIATNSGTIITVTKPKIDTIKDYGNGFVLKNMDSQKYLTHNNSSLQFYPTEDIVMSDWDKPLILPYSNGTLIATNTYPYQLSEKISISGGTLYFMSKDFTITKLWGARIDPSFTGTITAVDILNYNVRITYSGATGEQKTIVKLP